MIEKLKEDINPDKYIYKTGLTFAEDFCNELLIKVKESTDNLVFRNNYDDPRKDPRRTYQSIGSEQSRELIRRGRQIKKEYPDQNPISFNQYFLTPKDADQFLSLTPAFLKEIAPGEPVPIFQISHSGDLLPPHKGHKRKCSLFMLLQGNNEETRWYRETKPFNIIPTTRIPDLDKVEQVISARIESGHWYVFNHLEWHSVHRFSEGVRMNIGLDFDSITAEQLIEIIQNARDR